MRITQLLTRTAKCAKGKLVLTLFSGLAVFGATVVLGAPKPGFTVAASPATQTVTAGQNTSYGITVKRQNKFTGTVAMSVTGLPASTTGTFTPNPISSSGTSSTLAVQTNQGGTTPAGTYTLTIRGTNGSTNSTTTARLVVVSASQQNFALSATPAQSSISSNDSAHHQILITRSGGFTGAVTLSVGGLPNKVSAATSPNAASGSSSALTLTSNGAPKPGTYPLTVTGTGGGMTRSTSLTLVVEEKQPFDITGGLGQQLVPGARVPLNLALTNPNNFTLQVTGIAVSVDHQTSAAGCDGADNFSAGQIPANRYPLSLPANSTRTLGQLGVSDGDKPAVTMNDLVTVNQDACKGVTVYFNYSGGATK
jgi:hypothetical protein